MVIINITNVITNVSRLMVLAITNYRLQGSINVTQFQKVVGTDPQHNFVYGYTFQFNQTQGDMLCNVQFSYALST